MRTTPALSGMLGLLALGVIMAEGALKPGDSVPARDIRMASLDGRKLSIGDIAGKRGTLVIFACNHCPFVKAWESRIAAIGNDSLKKAIGVIAINANDPVAYPADDMAHMQTQAKSAGFEFPYVMDETSDVVHAFGAGRTPEAFLFDAGGRLIYHGAIDDNAYNPEKVQKRYLQDAIGALLAGKEVTLKETASLGCSIKFRAPASARE